MRRPPEFTLATDVMAVMADQYSQAHITPIEIDNTTVVSNATGFLNDVDGNWIQPPVRTALQTMNAFLIDNKSCCAESKYGAYVFDNDWWGGDQPADAVAYTAFYNTTVTSGLAIFQNVSKLCCQAVEY